MEKFYIVVTDCPESQSEKLKNVLVREGVPESTAERLCENVPFVFEDKFGGRVKFNSCAIAFREVMQLPNLVDAIITSDPDGTIKERRKINFANLKELHYA